MKTAMLAVTLLVSLAAFGQQPWSTNVATNPHTVYSTDLNANVVIGGDTANAFMRMTLVGAETLRYGPNPQVRLFDFDYNHQIGATQARNGAAMRIDLRWGDTPAAAVPTFTWFIRDVNQPLPDSTETQKMYLDKNGVLAIGYAAMFADATTKLQVNGNGKFAGNVTADGTISGGNVIAKYQDVAEWVPAEEEIGPATVVVLDPERPNHVIPSATAYDETVAAWSPPAPASSSAKAARTR